jgi:hypothetical protein
LGSLFLFFFIDRNRLKESSKMEDEKERIEDTIVASLVLVLFNFSIALGVFFQSRAISTFVIFI